MVIDFLFWHLHQIQAFNNNLSDGEIIISHTMCVIKQLFMIKISSLRETKKTITKKPWQKMLNDKNIVS